MLTANEICKLFNKQEIWRLLVQNYGNKLSKICKTTPHLEKRSFGRFEFCAFVDTPEYPRLKFSCINFIKVNYTLIICKKKISTETETGTKKWLHNSPFVKNSWFKLKCDFFWLVPLNTQVHKSLIMQQQLSERNRLNALLLASVT